MPRRTGVAGSHHCFGKLLCVRAGLPLGTKWDPRLAPGGRSQQLPPHTARRGSWGGAGVLTGALMCGEQGGGDWGGGGRLGGQERKQTPGAESREPEPQPLEKAGDVVPGPEFAHFCAKTR